MWAQLISTRLKEGREEDLHKLMAEFEAAERPGSGFIRTTVLRDQSDPAQIHMLVLFENEELARAREADPAREELLTTARALMAEIFEGPPEFTNLDVIDEVSA